VKNEKAGAIRGQAITVGPAPGRPILRTPRPAKSGLSREIPFSTVTTFVRVTVAAGAKSWPGSPLLMCIKLRLAAKVATCRGRRGRRKRVLMLRSN